MTDHVANEGSNLEKKVGDDKDWSGFLQKQLLSGKNFVKENAKNNNERKYKKEWWKKICTRKIFAVNLNSQGEKLKDDGWTKIHK